MTAAELEALVHSELQYIMWHKAACSLLLDHKYNTTFCLESTKMIYMIHEIS